ncbi:MCE family protein [Rhodococcus sp. AD45-ID]|uniref:MCE family protein n=1 Tax=Rhodococcus TaxID=1827 RepID=UPI0005D3B27A|nr:MULTISPECIES: MCE family protein [Rhodococcus]KJF20513.1 virulence factor Mce family protein [Rhodococcus sp. AD45]MCE4269121.1 MCE family protein [Rhodococcus globerulus]MDV8070391.1 MCE family protein [Rhodococcus sp. IEGM 1366]PSR41565.1 MCE family protein [Rhodococcus sp. AD45-ID]
MKRTVIAGAGLVVLLGASACSSEGIYAVPLPGGPDVGSNPMNLTIEFDDVLDLVPQSAVKVDGVPVGRVEKIGVGPDGWTADVRIILDSSVDLPANAVAAVEQTNLLGEKFIQLSAPPSGADTTAQLSDGDLIPLDRTRHATEIEQVLGALSLLLNGGGVGQLQPIVKELGAAFDGREGTTRSLLEQANTLIGGLNEQREDITRALDGLDVLSSRVNEQNEKIAKVLDELPVAISVLNEQRPQLTQMLAQVDRLGTVGTDVLTQSKDDLIADLQALRPTLQALAASGDDLVGALPLLPTFPFPDGVEKITQGGSVNLFLAVDLQIGNTLSGLGVGQGDPEYRQPKFGDPKPVVDPSNPYYNGNGPRPGWPTVSLLPIAPILPQLPMAPAVGAPLNPIQGMLDQFGIGGGQ